MTNYPQLFSLQDKIAVVLGAASGIGQASAHALGAMGAYVMCADRDESGAQATAQQIIDGGGAAGWMQTDAASGESIAQLAAPPPSMICCAVIRAPFSSRSAHIT